MRHGFIKVAAATPEIRVADCAHNRERIAQCMAEARQEGAQLLVLPALCVTGATCGDLFLQEALLAGAEEALLALRESTDPMLTVVGLPLRLEGRLYRCAAVLQAGSILAVIPDAAPDRPFAPAPAENGMIRFSDGTVAPFGTNLLLTCAGMPEFVLGVAHHTGCDRLARAGATILAHPAAHAERIGAAAQRRAEAAAESGRLCCGYVRAEAGSGESTTDRVFSGHNLIAERGEILAEAKPFQEGFALTELDLHCIAHDRLSAPVSADCLRITFTLPEEEVHLTRPIPENPFVPEDAAACAACCAEALAIQVHGLKRRLEHTRAKSVVIGVSGGLDSTLALLVAAKAMDLQDRPRADILAITMPCFGTTGRTRGNAERLSAELGVSCRSVDIRAAVTQHFEDIGQPMDRYDTTYENAQARERTQVLMDIANQSGGLVLGTGDLSELALGWATYNGDHMSMYGVNASVPKTLIRHIVRHEAEQAGEGALRDVLLDILDTPVSPELLPAQDGEIAQQTEHIVGPYELHDFFLYWLVRWGAEPEKIRRLAVYAFDGEYDETIIREWLSIFLRRFFAQQFKRSCLPDGPQVGEISLSPRGAWSMPSDASSVLWLGW